MLFNNSGNELVQRQVERVGRYQFALMGAALSGFIVLGKDFFELWLGVGFEDCYALVLILTVPVLFPLVQNVCLSVLRAKKQMTFRTISLACSCFVNFVITWIGIKLWGYWGAAIGTAASTVINFISMNIYYHVKLEFKIFIMFRNITKRTWLCLVLSAAITFVFREFVNGGWLQFVSNVFLFLLIYGVSMLLFGLSSEERVEIVGPNIFKKRS
jgi:O-antigen/teichoic acid export membrane protein